MPRPTMNRVMARGACALLLATAGLGSPAAAGTLQIDPVKLEISKTRKTASLSIRNEEKVPVTIRAYAMAWNQDAGSDRYEESSAIIVSPPIFTMAAGATQTVRVGLRSPDAGGRAYRLIVEEVPEANAGTGVRVALRLDLPLYAGLQAGTPSDLGWSLFRNAQGMLVAEARNRGSGYVRVEPEALAATTGLRLPGVSFGTVLPGESRQWVLGAKPEVADRARFQSLLRTDAGAPNQVSAQAN